MRRALQTDLERPDAWNIARVDNCPWAGLYIRLNQSRGEQFVLLDNCGGARVYEESGNTWKAAGTMHSLRKAPGTQQIRNALESSDVEPIASEWSDLRIGNRVYRFDSVEQ